MKKSNKGGGLIQPAPPRAEHGAGVHMHCNILEICPGASLKGLPQRKFDRLVRDVRRTLERLRQNPQPFGNGRTETGTQPVRMARGLQCWEIGRYYVTIDGEPHLCIQFRCEDGSTY